MQAMYSYTQVIPRLCRLQLGRYLGYVNYAQVIPNQGYTQVIWTTFRLCRLYLGYMKAMQVMQGHSQAMQVKPRVIPRLQLGYIGYAQVICRAIQKLYVGFVRLYLGYIQAITKLGELYLRYTQGMQVMPSLYPILCIGYIVVLYLGYVSYMQVTLKLYTTMYSYSLAIYKLCMAITKAIHGYN